MRKISIVLMAMTLAPGVATAGDWLNAAILLPTSFKSEVCGALGDFVSTAKFRRFSKRQKQRFMLADLRSGEKLIIQRANRYGTSALAAPALAEIRETRSLVRAGRIGAATEKAESYQHTLNCQ